MNSPIKYEDLRKEDFDAFFSMTKKLWIDFKADELESLLKKTVVNSANQKVILAKNQNNEAIGFVQVSVRFDYVEGAEKSPTGYLEGVFIEEPYRKMGIAKQLIRLGEDWLKMNDCNQIGSDTWLWNKDAQNFHQKIGFWEEDRLVHFLKNID